MYSNAMEPLYRVSFGSMVLNERYSPRFDHPHKSEILRRSCPDGVQTSGAVTVSRWPRISPPQAVTPSESSASAETGVFEYRQSPSDGVRWHLNFADRDLFAYYGGALLAQDELQVLEHPVLGSIREALVSTGKSTLVTEGRQPTPVLIRGAQRRLHFDTSPTSKTPHGLYGNHFACADLETVLNAVEVLNPPTTSNILAIEAPAYGHGEYSRDEIERILSTAYTGFRAAVLETAEAIGRDARTVIHTGFWGCGAYGGDRVLMTALQLLAARLAEVDELVYHTFDEAGMADFREGHFVLEETAPAGRLVGEVIEDLGSMGFRWGVSDGN